MKKLNQNGFTLVEVVIVSALSLVVGGALFSTFFMYTSQSSQSISSLVVQQEYDNVLRQIGRDVRRASFVLKEGETPATHGSASDTVKTIVLWDASGAVFAKYRIDGNSLLEGMSQISYTAGSGAVTVSEATSFFVVTSKRKGVNIDLAVSKNTGNNQFTMAPHSDMLVCRN